MERIARDSEKDHWTVMEALCAFIRDESTKKTELSVQALDQLLKGDTGEEKTSDSTIGIKQIKLRSDIQIALTVLGRRSWVDKELERGLRLNLRGSNLSSADLSQANLNGANLIETNLIGANLTGANLKKALLCFAELSLAQVTGANLTGANLSYATLDTALLFEADITEADTVGIKFSDAPLFEDPSD